MVDIVYQVQHYQTWCIQQTINIILPKKDNGTEVVSL